MATARLIVDPPHDGSWNMAADELLLDLAARDGATCIRFYAWVRPTWSLGRSQPYGSSVDERFCRARGIDIVRRPTGGWGLLHDREVTYSVASPASRGAFAGGPLESYRKIAVALARGLQQLGAPVSIAAGPSRPPEGPLCFTAVSSHEIVAIQNGRPAGKLVGSAQRRRRGAFLQHGSIPFERDSALEAAAAGVLPNGAPGAGPWTPGAGGPCGSNVALAALCGRPIGFEESAHVLSEAFASLPGLSLAPLPWREEELLGIERLRADRYLRAAWTRSGARA